MNRKARRIAEAQRRIDNRKFSSAFDACDEFVNHALRGSNSPHVVVGPVVWQPSDGKASKRWYFSVATSEPERGFRADELTTDSKEDCEEFRANVLLSLTTRHSPLIVHVMDDELAEAKLCEMLWPGERITKLRKAVEAERTQ